MTTADQVNLIFFLGKSVDSHTQFLFKLAIVDQSLVGEGEKATFFADGGLVKDWKKSQRLIVIVAKHDASHALFVYIVKALPVTSVNDLSIESIIAIDDTFKCDIDSGDAEALYLNITGSNKSKLMLQMVPGFHTQNLVSEIFRLLSENKSSANDKSSFDWLEKYNPKAGKTSSLAFFVRSGSALTIHKQTTLGFVLN